MVRFAVRLAALLAFLAVSPRLFPIEAVGGLSATDWLLLDALIYYQTLCTTLHNPTRRSPHREAMPHHMIADHVLLLPSCPVENELVQKLLLDFHAACSRKPRNDLKK